ncbi:hypothetical protein HY643_03970 [Candidatus Woesearchaeota archaeon]|nr:hypothetical protein [Candidatus Woesearchaeota archaeon]
MPLYQKFLELLNLSEEERDKLNNSHPLLKKFYKKSQQKKQPALKLEQKLREKINNAPLQALIQTYFSLKENPLNVIKLQGIGSLRKAQYKQEINSLLANENDPARFFSSLGQLCEQIKKEIAYTIGEHLTKEVGKKTLDYLHEGLEYLEGIK